MEARYHVMIDPSGSLQEVVADYDPGRLAEAEAAGYAFAAVDGDGASEPVAAADMEPPWEDREFTLVAPEYVDVRMEAALDVLEIMAEALEAVEVGTISGGAVTLSANSAKATGLTEAMARLRAVVRKEEADADS